MKIPWMPKEAIAQKAEELLSNYEKMTGYSVKPPTPIEDIAERRLGLNIGFEDLRQKMGLDDVLGATYVKARRISIDNSLLNENTEGRLIFTCAHEVGHWVLHRRFVDVAERSGFQQSFIFCRIKDAKRPIEWQADYFASCTLLPEKYVREAWDETYGPEPLTLFNVKSAFSGPLCFDPCVNNWYLIADRVREAGGFSNVSKQAYDYSAAGTRPGEKQDRRPDGMA